MTDFFINDSVVQLIFSGAGIILFFLLFIYIVGEIVYLTSSKMSIIHATFIYFRVNYQIKKLLINTWWSKKIPFISIHKGGKNIVLNIYINRVDNNKKCSLVESIGVDYLGRVSKDNIDKLVDMMYVMDAGMIDELKSYKRNKALEKLGIT